MNKITDWIVNSEEGYAYRHIVGKDPDDVAYRVALIEKSPRVRIRSAYLGVEHGTYEDGAEYTERRWPEHLDWCYGEKGNGPTDEDSVRWCDGMLKALGYEL